MLTSAAIYRKLTPCSASTRRPAKVRPNDIPALLNPPLSRLRTRESLDSQHRETDHVDRLQNDRRKAAESSTCDPFCDGTFNWHVRCKRLPSNQCRERVLNKVAMLVEDNLAAAAVRLALEAAGLSCVSFASTLALLRGLQRDDHALVVLDIDARSTDWRGVVERRRNWLNVKMPVLLIGDPRPGAAAQALETGADDFVAKPFAGGELTARVQAVFRRRAAGAQPVELAACRLDAATRSLVSPRARIQLTAREMAVAQILFEHAGQLVPRRRLALEVWGSDEDLTGRSIEQHVYQLRRKLRLCAGEALSLCGVYGSGYRLDVVERFGVAA
jgi:DNA-binding response OmpR family regulator